MFHVSQLPQKAIDVFNQGFALLWPVAVREAVEAQFKDVNVLTNMVFFMHHPERMSNGTGKALKSSEPNFTKLAAEWNGFKTLILPILENQKTETPSGTRTRIKQVGAWCGASTLNSPHRDVEFAVEHNINRLDVIVNDHSKFRSPHTFTIYDRRKIEKLCEVAQKQKIEVHLMSWIMPHEKYIDGAARELVPLCQSTGASSLQWDAEGPWTGATGSVNYTKAANHLQSAFSDLGCPMGVNAIGFASKAKVGPLLAVCDYGVPQAYSTAGSKSLTPGTGQTKVYRSWMDKFGKPIVMGLAAYNQRGISGHTISTAMNACIQATEALGITSCIFWHLNGIRKTSMVATAVKGILA
ncbi:MAG: hypothetical protein OEU99_14275 [Nitrospira sp.]|nr:hypothetical protein [Nitrospira sp.]